MTIIKKNNNKTTDNETTQQNEKKKKNTLVHSVNHIGDYTITSGDATLATNVKETTTSRNLEDVDTKEQMNSTLGAKDV